MNSKWTPCSKELPKTRGAYLVWIDSTEPGDFEKQDWADTDGFNPETGAWDNDEQREGTNERIVAWMPLPEPFEGDTCSDCFFCRPLELCNGKTTLACNVLHKGILRETSMGWGCESFVRRDK